MQSSQAAYYIGPSDYLILHWRSKFPELYLAQTQYNLQSQELKARLFDVWLFTTSLTSFPAWSVSK